MKQTPLLTIFAKNNFTTLAEKTSIMSEAHSPLTTDHTSLTDESPRAFSKKVLIITYYWPPSGGSGVQRWLKFVKYLPTYGWEPHVLTPENPAFPLRDPSLEDDVPPEAEVLRLPIWEPYNAFASLSRLFGAGGKTKSVGSVPSAKGSLFQRVSAWIRGNFFVPDPRVFWVKPSVRFLGDYLKDNGIQIVITTGPPHSMHLIGMGLKRKYPHLRWLADFRDPWTEWGIWDSLRVTQLVRGFHKRIERRVLATADEIITITPFYQKRFESLSGRRVRLLTNGFDEDDFRDLVWQRPDKFVIRHVGIVNERCDPRVFLRALANEVALSKEFANDIVLEFNGEVHGEVLRFVHQDDILRRVTVFTGNVPHRDLLKLYGRSSLLLLILSGYKDAAGFLPGKLFEYFATGLPVLGVGPLDGDAAFVLNRYEAGTMVADDDVEGMRRVIRDTYRQWRSPGEQHPRVPVGDFSRQAIAGQLATILGQHLSQST